MKILNVQNLVQDQSQKHKDRLLSQFSRLLDSAPSFPIYYSIDGVNSSAEIGTRDVMSYVSNDSPVKFKKILNMPIYNLNAITANVIFDEMVGLYTDFEDQGTVLNSVLKPLPGDHFIVPEFNPEVMFVVTEVLIRAIRGEDHYTIGYAVVPSSRILNIERQVVEVYETTFRNIGTENTVLLKQSDYNLVAEYTDVYARIMERYIDENYNESCGYLATPEWLTASIGHGTCKYLIKFLMANSIIYFDEILNSVFAFESVLPFEANHNKLYAQSFILNNFIKKNVPNETVYVDFKPLPISLFHQFEEIKLGQSVEFIHTTSLDYTPTATQVQIYGVLFTSKLTAKDYTDMTPLEFIISKFVNDEDITIPEFEAAIDDYESSDIFRFYFLPMVLMILKVRIKALQLIAK